MSSGSGGPYASGGADGDNVHGIPVMPLDIQARRSEEGWELFSDSLKLVLTKWNTLATAVDQEVRFL